jgi:septum site-determining protein MinD
VTGNATLALVGTVGGAGTTRLTVEFGATLARAGRDVALVDAAFATQGLARHVPGRVDADLTDLLTGDAPLDAGLRQYPVDLPGQLAVAPARAPFERLARAKTPEAAEQFEALVRQARRQFDHVLVDTPPVAANQAVAAVSAADTVALVVPASERGLDRLPTMRDRLHDIGAPVDSVVANWADDDDATVGGADATVPESEARELAALPVCAAPDAAFAPAVADAVESCLDTDLALSFPDSGLLDGYVG